jgi:hypothetical protein
MSDITAWIRKPADWEALMTSFVKSHNGSRFVDAPVNREATVYFHDDVSPRSMNTMACVANSRF